MEDEIWTPERFRRFEQLLDDEFKRRIPNVHEVRFEAEIVEDRTAAPLGLVIVVQHGVGFTRTLWYN